LRIRFPTHEFWGTHWNHPALWGMLPLGNPGLVFPLLSLLTVLVILF
jgi:hypothetical protein